MCISTEEIYIEINRLYRHVFLKYKKHETQKWARGSRSAITADGETSRYEGHKHEAPSHPRHSHDHVHPTSTRGTRSPYLSGPREHSVRREEGHWLAPLHDYPRSPATPTLETCTGAIHSHTHTNTAPLHLRQCSPTYSTKRVSLALKKGHVTSLEAGDTVTLIQ